MHQKLKDSNATSVAEKTDNTAGHQDQTHTSLIQNSTNITENTYTSQELFALAQHGWRKIKIHKKHTYSL